MIAAAEAAGLAGIVMTEHLPLPSDLDPHGHLALSEDDLPLYAEEVLALAAEKTGIEVVLGAEADWLPGREGFTLAGGAQAVRLGVRVFLGSVHFLGDWAFDDPHHLEEWDRRDVDAVWAEYFAQWCLAARAGHFDVMAHPDLPKKFGHKPGFDPRDLYSEAARAAADGGVLIEISTAGLRKPVGELYPGAGLLAAFRSAGVGVTFGSDAHAPGEVGMGFDLAAAAARAAGFDKVAFPRGAGEVRWLEL
jgi:histidinol-phosphatase (PHP family)